MDKENVLEDLAYMQHTLDKMGDVLQENLRDKYNSMAAQDIISDMLDGYDKLADIVESEEF